MLERYSPSNAPASTKNPPFLCCRSLSIITGCPDWPFKRVAWESGLGWAEEEEESLLEEEKGGMMNWDLRKKSKVKIHY